MADRPGLSGDSAAAKLGHDVELLGGLGDGERLSDDHLEGFVTPEVLLDGGVVEAELPVPGRR